MHLIGDGVVDSILNGVDVGVAQRRRPRSTVTKQSSRESLAVSGINRGCVNTSSSSSGSSINSSHSGASSHTKTNAALAASSNTTSGNTSHGGTSSNSLSNTTATTTAAGTRTSGGSNRVSAGSRPSTTVTSSGSSSVVQGCSTTSVTSVSSSGSSRSTSSPQAASLRGLRTSKSAPKPAPKRKQESPAPPPTPPLSASSTSKPPRKSPLTKRARPLTVASNDSSDSASDSVVCKQTCNVLVKRIEEEEKGSNETKAGGSQQKVKPKPPRLRDKGGQVKKPPDLSPAATEAKESPPEDKQEPRVPDSQEEESGKRSRRSIHSDPVETKTNVIATDDSGSKRQTRKTLVEDSPKRSVKEDIPAIPKDGNGNVPVPDTVVKTCDAVNSTQSDVTDKEKTDSQPPNTKVPGEKKREGVRDTVPPAPPLPLVPPPATVTKVSPLSSPSKPAVVAPSVNLRELPTKPEDVVKARTSTVSTTAFPPSTTTREGGTNAAVTVENVSPQSNEDMHYKKQLLRAGGNISPSNSGQGPSISEGIDVNRPLTEQLAKRNRALDQLSVNGDLAASSAQSAKSTSSVSYSYHLGETRVEASPTSVGPSKTHDVISERHGSAFTSVSSRTTTPASSDSHTRADSRASDGQLPGHLSSGEGSRLDDLRSVRSSPGSSPLIVDRHEAVHPYRDPELMRKNPVHSNVQNILAAQQQQQQQQHKMSQPSFPPTPGGGTPSQAAAAAAAAAGYPGVPPLAGRGLLSSLPSTLAYTSTHQLPASISPHLSLSHSYPMEALVRAQQQQHMAAAMHQQLMGYPAAPTMATLESLWKRFPSTPLPQAWPPGKGQEALISGELAAIQREQLQLQLERERHAEQERREKERKELIERERLEKEKAEREKAERERIERERDRLAEKERLERLERERQEWEHHKQNQERILRESAVDSVAAVDQHFAESLTRLATQQGIVPSMFGSISQGTARPSFIPKSEGGHGLPPHSLAAYHEKMLFEQQQQRNKEEKMKAESDAHIDEKRFISKPGDKAVFPGYPFSSSSLPYPAVTHGGQPVFNLYGVPSAHSTISTEQLKQLIPDSRPSIKEEVGSRGLPHHALAHRQKEVKREPHNSVIVKRESKLPLASHPGVKLETPVTAHSHHSSPSSSSPRLQHPRPAHTPEHRPDRPLSSSTAASPASSLPPHLLHHSTGPGFHHEPPQHRSQSPYKPVTSQPVHPSSMPQPLDYCKSPNPHGSKQPKPEPFPPAGGPPVSHPTAVSSGSLGYNYSLIQQGLVPNPIYSQGGAAHQPKGQHPNQPPPLVGPQGSKAQVSPQSGSIKRKQAAFGNKDSAGSGATYSRKKLKGQSEIPPMASGQMNMSIPVTTPEILSNPSPYTTTSSNIVFSRPPGAQPTTSSLSTGYNDTFRSFVEIEVEMAYQQDQERERRLHSAAPKWPPAGGGPAGTADRKPELPPSLNPAQHSAGDPMAATPSSSSSTSTSTGPGTVVDSSYSSRIMDTINRVANNQVDTDSDTLSASSPPPPPSKPSGTNSPLNRSGGPSHPHHMKKAWLQRHDEDKKSEMPTPPPVVTTVCSTPTPPVPPVDSPAVPSRGDGISCVETPGTPATDGQVSRGSTPANVVVTLTNGNSNDLNHRNDESTSSASEAEMQFPKSSKKRVKSRKPTPPSGPGQAKKAKSEAEDSPVPVSSAVSAPTTLSGPSPPGTITSHAGAAANGSNNSRKKANNPKKGKGEKDTKVKEEPSSGVSTPVPPSTSTTSSNKKEESSPKASPMELSPSPAPNLPGKAQVVALSSASMNTPSPHSERSNPSPALSEGGNAPQNMSSSMSNSSSSSSSSNKGQNCNTKDKDKDKKKSRRSKETPQKDGKKSSSFNKPLVKQTVATLKKTLEPFIQDGSCSEITPKLGKCRECKMTPTQRSKKQPNIFCRFYAFRRLKYSSRGLVTIDGFSELSDAEHDDIEPWLPRYPTEEPHLDVENSKFIISRVGDKFCELVHQEKEAKSWAGEDVKIAWKRAVMGVREMCDVCDTTLFNMHWVCQKCGFVVCLDCYKVRVKEGKKALLDDRWMTCTSNKQHEASKMMLTQIIPSDALWELGRLIHDIRIKWSIPSNCMCGGTNGKLVPKNGINQQLLQAVNSGKLANGLGEDHHSSKQASSKTSNKKQQDALKSLEGFSSSPDNTSSLSLLAEVASMDSNSQRDKAAAASRLDKTTVPGDEFLEEAGDKKSGGGCSTLRELLTKTAGKPKQPKSGGDKKSKKGSGPGGNNAFEDIIQSVVEKNCLDGGTTTPFKFLHYTPRLGGWKRELPIIMHSLTETSVLYPDIPHSWLCKGRLLHLLDAHHKGNLQIFQEQWKRGQPVLVSCANKQMNLNLWKPEVFIREFGDIENEVVNCRTGDVIIGHNMRDFWDGFESLSKRPVDDQDDPMLLKLKDWPPGDDFSELLPSRFQDLMKALPLPEYTNRNGKLNLASRLPDFLVRPDLGPKMYNAYGSSQFPKEGTTNLHLDISDAVNVMVYVGIPGDGPGGRKAQEDAAVKAIDEAGCDSITKCRVREVHEVPGALWHIYDAHDADKIRDFLNKVAKERGESIEKDHDAIHDQSWYLDKELCDRLRKEYGVEGYTIVQCEGDAIFIPAGAPHQVRNLHSCIKVAEDFVSPEHLNHCFRLTQEFRQLSDTHSNHEDKLQVKNIVYHAVKDAIAVLKKNEPDD